MQNMSCRFATLVLSIFVLAYPANRGLVIADDSKSDQDQKQTALREATMMLISLALENALKQAMEDSMRALELKDPIEKGIYLAVLSEEGGTPDGESVVGHSTVSIVLMRPANNQESQKTLKDPSGNLDVVFTKIRTRNVKSETATAVFVDEVTGGFEVHQLAFVYDSKQGWRKVETAVSAHRRAAK
jgi:hypothetical protein